MDMLKQLSVYYNNLVGLTPLIVASSCGHVDALIQVGSDVNKQSHFGFTPLFFAVKRGQSTLIVEALLMYGTSPNITATSNETPLDVTETLKKWIALVSY